MVNIRRDHFEVTEYTRVCTRHFFPEDLIQPSNPDGRRRLRKRAVPVLFEWNNFSLPSTRPSIWERRERQNSNTAYDDCEDQEMDVTCSGHDYCSTTEPAALDLALNENAELRAEIARLRGQVEEMALSRRFGLKRFTSSDENIKLYTR